MPTILLGVMDSLSRRRLSRGVYLERRGALPLIPANRGFHELTP